MERTKARAAERRRWPAILGLLVLLLVLLLILFDWNWLKGPVERRVQAATGRSFVIAGNLAVDLGRVTTIHAENLQFGNAEWAKATQMASLQRLDLSIALWPLLRGDIVLPRIHLEKPQLLIERNDDGAGNWQLGDSSTEPTAAADLPRIGQLSIAAGELRLHEPSLQTDLRLDIRSGEAAAADSAFAPIVARGEGRYRGHPFELRGQVSSPLDLQDAQQPFRLDAHARAGKTQMQVDGALTAPLQLQDFDLHFALSGADLADLYPLLGIALPPTPPYRLDGRIGRTGTTWHYRDFSGLVGGSDLGGSVAIELAGLRPLLRAELTSKKLDLDDLAGFIGATPDAGAGATQQQKTSAQAASTRVLPDTPYDLGKLRAMDAAVSLRAAEIHAPGLPLDSMAVHLTLDDGLLRLDPLDVGVAGGSVKGALELDARQDPISVKTSLRARKLDLPKLVPGSELMKDAVGKMGGSAQLQTRGNSVAQMLGHANGDVGVAMGKGRISNLLVELVGLDLAEALRYFVGKDRIIDLRCVYADFGVTNGVMKSRALALDTTDTALHGEGSIDLGQETLALRLIPQPKDMSPLTLRTPLHIGGTFKSPKVRPEAGPLVLRAAVAAGLFAIAPPAALLALIETGPGEDLDCRRPNAPADVAPNQPAPKSS